MEKYRRKKGRCSFMAVLMIAVGGVFIFSFMMMAVSKESVTKAAGETVHIWDGTADTSWYEESQNFYEISTPEQLAGLAKLVNEDGVSFNGKCFDITADLYFNEDWENYESWEDEAPVNEWIPIGTETNPFSVGTIDGYGHKLYGLYVNQGEGSGLMGVTRVPGDFYINNLHIDSSYISGTSYVGAFLGQGLIQLTGCSNRGVVKGTGDYVGGLVGSALNSGNMHRCCNLGPVSGGSYVGGLSGVSGCEIVLCYNWGDVSGTECVGGIIGKAVGMQIVDSVYVIGNVTGEKKTGAIMGWKATENMDYSMAQFLSNKQCNTDLNDIGCDENGLPVPEKNNSHDEEFFTSGRLAHLWSASYGQIIGQDKGPVFLKEDEGNKVFEVIYEDEVSYTSGINRDSSKYTYVNKGSYLEYWAPQQIPSFVFEGWYMDKNYKYKWDFENTPITKDRTLYAKWGNVPDSTPIPTPEPIYEPEGEPEDTPAPVVTNSPAETPEPSPIPVISPGPDTGSKVKDKKSPVSFVKNGIRYRVIKSGKTRKQVSVEKFVKTSRKEVSIPASVKYKTVRYDVVKINKSAFAKAKKLEKVVIGKNITAIGEKAFYNAKKLERININTKKLTKIGKKAFVGIYSQATIRIPKSRKKKYVKLLEGKY